MIVQLQNWIHNLEEGGGAKVLKGVLGVLAFVFVMLLYNVREFQNLGTQEAMEQAQLARNIAQGKGFTTDVIRPLDLFVLQQHQKSEKLTVTLPQPDLANAPAYPWLLAQWMKVGSWNYDINQEGEFNRFQPDQRIAYLNQLLFFVLLLFLFRLAKRLFDEQVAWFSVIVLGGTDLFWRFSQAGLPNLLAALLIVVTMWLLTKAEQGARESKWPLWKVLPFLLLGGAVLGLAGLTRYSLVLLVLPALVYVFHAFEERRGVLSLTLLIGFAAVLTPWLQRNLAVCGKPFGTASYAVYAASSFFPGDELERALKPEDVSVASDLGKYGVEAHWEKLMDNVEKVIVTDLPRLGGTWLSAFFLASLLLPFTRPGLVKLRLWMVLSLVALVVTQALGRTHASTVSPELNGENLLLVLVPLVVMFGAGMFNVLADQLKPVFDPGRGIITGGFIFIFSLPLVMNLLTPRPSAWVYPPFHPPVIQQASAWLQQDEWMVSDMPAAVAWYGRRQSLLIPRDYTAEFTVIQQAKPVNALYLTSISLDRKLLTEMSGKQAEPWSEFGLNSVIKGELPDGFPLKHAYADWFPYQLFLADKQRW
ncbi:MAG: glycosyltransferase family 39 protein [Verrucomicrobiota bacterium]